MRYNDNKIRYDIIRLFLFNTMFVVPYLMQCFSIQHNVWRLLRQLCDVIAAPTKAQITDNQTAKQLNKPNLPYLTQL